MKSLEEIISEEKKEYLKKNTEWSRKIMDKNKKTKMKNKDKAIKYEQRFERYRYKKKEEDKDGDTTIEKVKDVWVKKKMNQMSRE